MLPSLFDPINVASFEFALIVLVVLLIRLVGGERTLPYTLAATGLFMAATWIDMKALMVLIAALVPHYFITRYFWGQPERARGRVLTAAILWQIAVLTSTKITGLSAQWGIYGVIGLSYMTFRQIGLLLSAARQSAPFRSIDWLSFMLNPFTLVAGPIQSWDEHVDQYADTKSQTRQSRITAAHLIATGLIKITVLAPIFAGQDDFAKLATANADALDWFISYFSYYIFLYLDFSGYVDVVMGCGILCGYKLPENFNRPYLSTNFQDFWNRWHITLGTWFQAHVFTPMLVTLQRSRRFKSTHTSIVLALVAVFLLIGVWHGIAWNYVLFGVIHALGVVGTYMLGRRRLKLKKAGKLRELSDGMAKLSFGVRLVAFQIFVAGTFVLLNNDVSTVWEALIRG